MTSDSEIGLPSPKCHTTAQLTEPFYNDHSNQKFQALTSNSTEHEQQDFLWAIPSCGYHCFFSYAIGRRLKSSTINSKLIDLMMTVIRFQSYMRTYIRTYIHGYT